LALLLLLLLPLLSDRCVASTAALLPLAWWLLQTAYLQNTLRGVLRLQKRYCKQGQVMHPQSWTTTDACRQTYTETDRQIADRYVLQQEQEDEHRLKRFKTKAQPSALQAK
jgi:hypothetical protein